MLTATLTMPGQVAADLLTVAEVAAFLNVRPRTIYELVRTKRIPNRTLGGQLLFPRTLVELWVSQFPGLRPANGHLSPPPRVIAGSHDPLLEWSAQQSGSGLTVRGDGDVSAVDRLLAGQAVACSINLIDPATGTYDASIAAERLAGLDVAVIEWARRRQGIMVAPGNPSGIKSVADLANTCVRVAIPSKGSGSAVLFSKLLADAHLTAGAIQRSGQPTRSDLETGMAVASGRAEAGLGIEAVANSQGLDFIPVHWERLDLIVRHSEFFEAPLQKLFSLARTSGFRKRAVLLGGYNVAKTGRVILNLRM
jgi:excisionase family DNA binding protein